MLSVHSVEVFVEMSIKKLRHVLSLRLSDIILHALNNMNFKSIYFDEMK